MMDQVGHGDGQEVTQHFVFYSTTPQDISGLSSYTDSAVSAYARRFPKRSIVLHTNADRAVLQQCAVLGNLSISRLSGLEALPYKLRALWVLTHLAWRLRHSQRPLVSTTPMTALWPFIPLIITIHDVYDVSPAYRSWHNVLFFRLYFAFMRHRLRAVIAVSESTSLAIHPYLVSGRSRIVAIREASRFPVLADADLASAPTSRDLLFVANVQPNKNFSGLLDILDLAKEQELSFRLVWVGRDAKGEATRRMAARSHLQSIDRAGILSDADLRAEYAAARALIITSSAEGFCLPVLEAQAHGCPVIATDIPILREVAGPDSLFFPLNDAAAAVAILRRVFADDFDLRTARLLALANARRFSWEKGAEALEALVS